ncbi:XopAW family type III secretion system calcium-binding effector [Hylemonella sp. W303a]|uniref:XopAW family type III secretion system calcium-binding effector n=1 Tax=Hylemonella sp. W303a TaxID=3389873 RepID=UPI00396B3ADD
MSSISGISGASSAWSSMIAMRGNRPPAGKDPAEMFAKVDTDGNGSVDETELQTMLDDISEKTGTSFDASAGELLGKMDSDGDGSLSQAELEEGMRSLLPPPSTMDFAQSRGAEGVDDLFGKIDTDGDGKVSSDELQALYEKMGIEEDATERFAELDTDGDGSLSQTEFEAGRPQPPGGMPPPPPSADASDSSDSTTDALQALLDALDSNGDHQVSDEEAQSFLEQLNEEQQAAQSGQGSESSTQRLTLLVQQAYAQLSATFSSQGTTVNATA